MVALIIINLRSNLCKNGNSMLSYPIFIGEGMEKKCGVYKITCLKNGKIYIGSSSDIKNRKRHHFLLLKNGFHGNRILQKNYNKYGKDQFSFDVIEECELTNITEREQFYIDSLNCLNKKLGMNIMPNAYSSLGYKYTQESKIRLKKSLSSSSYKTKKSKIMKKLWKDPIYRQKMCEERRDRWKNPEFIQKRMESFCSKENRKRSSEIAKCMWNDPEKREILVKERKTRWTETERKKASERNKKRFSNPNSVSDETRKKLSIATKASWEIRKGRSF